jgi:hypothetical protein
MSSLEGAKVAKKELEGTSMYITADINVMMRIQYSTMERLDIGNETERARDYTKET